MTVTDHSRRGWMLASAIFICALLLSIPRTALAQSAHVTLNVRNAALKTCMEEVERQTSYLFVYDEDCNLDSRVTVKIDSKPLGEALGMIFRGTGISFRISGSNVVLAREKASGTAGGGDSRRNCAAHLRPCHRRFR